MGSKSLLGEMLLEKKLIMPEQLQRALAEQRDSKEPLGQVLIRLGLLTEAELRGVLSEQLGVSFLTKEELKPRADQRLKELIPPQYAKEHHILPLGRQGKVLKIAATKMPDLIFLDNLRKMTGLEVSVVLSTEEALHKVMEEYYSSVNLQEVVSSSEVEAETALQGVETEREGKVDLEAAASAAGQAPVVKLVDFLLKKALDDRASDIHVEPSVDKLTIRYRVDGILYELPPPPKELLSAIVSRIKIISKLDIAEKRIPQDGSFAINYQGRRVDVRVSTIPVIFGEKVVMRILDKRMDLLNMLALGFEPEQLEQFETALLRPYGLIFVTGPTGSGKSTTLYSAMNRLLSPEINIVTIEDPVEYQLTGINQVEVKPEIGLTFASGLRAFLRQDPDVMLVGEVRDLETAEICIRASLTGHLVLSTLHTNDAITAVTRLIDIGVPAYLVAGSLALVAAQRLIRLLCPDCKEPYVPDEKVRKDYGVQAATLYKAKGCPKCNKIGYWGRAAIYEVVPIDEDFRRLITRNAGLDDLRKLQKDKKHTTLFTSGMKKVEKGLTTIDEVLSVAYE